MSGTQPFVIKLNKSIRNVRLSDSVAKPDTAEPLVPGDDKVSANIEPVTEDGPTTNQPSPDEKELLLATRIIGEIHEQLASLEQSRAAANRFIQELAVELSMAMTAKILQTQLDEDSFPFQAILEELIEKSGVSLSDEPLRVEVNHQDLESIKSTCALAELPDGELPPINWVVNDRLPRGSLQLDSGKYSLYYDAKLHLQEVRKEILEALNGSQIENRKSEGAGSTLRRYPDRRASS